MPTEQRTPPTGSWKRSSRSSAKPLTTDKRHLSTWGPSKEGPFFVVAVLRHPAQRPTSRRTSRPLRPRHSPMENFSKPDPRRRLSACSPEAARLSAKFRVGPAPTRFRCPRVASSCPVSESILGDTGDRGRYRSSIRSRSLRVREAIHIRAGAGADVHTLGGALRLMKIRNRLRESSQEVSREIEIRFSSALTRKLISCRLLSTNTTHRVFSRRPAIGLC